MNIRLRQNDTLCRQILRGHNFELRLLGYERR